MKYLSDLHTHTIVSGHAFSTLLENVEFCRKSGIKILGVSDHGPTMPAAPHQWYFGSLRILPRYIDDVMVLKGCELNILDALGNVDLEERQQQHLDYAIASLHEVVYKPKSVGENTLAIINAVKRNPKVEILGHLGNPSYELDYRKIVKFAKDNDIMIEINNSSVSGSSRPGSKENCIEIARLCKEIGTKVILSSDAHYRDYIGKFDGSLDVLKAVDMPEQLIMNNPDKLIAHLKSKGKLSDLEFMYTNEKLSIVEKK